MAVHTEEVQEVSRGLAKELDEAALSMIFDNLQKHQYQFPIKSTIRELVSNAVDASREKMTALEIITGRAKEEDYYLRRDEAMFKDSNFHKEYYDPSFLSEGETVMIVHEYGSTKDLLIIKDPGVGLGVLPNPETGVSRLEGYFKLAYSSKRNTNSALGKFGLGAKSPLSTGTDYYTMITRHNGREFQFNIYSYKVDNVVPQWDMETTLANEVHYFHEGTDKEFKFYSKATKMPNGTEIQVPTKRIHRQQVIDAVKNQLLYFRNVDFHLVHEDDRMERVNFRANILYEDEHLIISDNDQFSKPHMILNGVNYGYANFLEMEMEEMTGNVGFKVDPTKVEINPSRESLIWLGKTVETVKNSIAQASISAANIVQKRLDETDFLKWLKVASTLVSSTGSDPVLAKLGTVVDRGGLKPKFGPNPLIKYIKDTNIMFEGILLTTVTRETYFDQKSSSSKFKAKRATSTIADLVGLPLYCQTENTLPSRDQHLLAKHPEGYVKVRFIKPGDNDSADVMFAKISEKGNEKAKKWNDRRVALYKLLKAASVSYESVVVPKEVEEELNAAEAAVAMAKMSPEELRKINQQIVVHQITPYSRNKHEPTIKSILEDEGLVIYGTTEHETLLSVVFHTLNVEGHSISSYSDELKIVLVSKPNAKHFARHTHVTDFIRYYDKTTKTIGMHNKLVLAQTARKINEHKERLMFMEEFKPFNSLMYVLYTEVMDYCIQHYSGKGENAEINAYADKVAELQLFIEDHKDDANAIAVKSKEIFDFSFEGAVGLDLPIYRKLEVLLDYVEPIHVIMNKIRMDEMSAELEQEIREILRNKKVAMC